MTLEADVVVVGSGAGGGVIAGELAVAGHKVIVIEMGGYFDESDFLGLELTAYQQLFLNGGPFTTAEGQVGLQAGSSLGGGTVLNWTNCLRTPHWVAIAVGGRARARGPRRRRLRRSPRRGLGAARDQRPLLRSERPAPAAQGGLRGARRRLQADHPQHRPRDLRPGHRRLHGLRRAVGLEALDAEDLPADAAEAGAEILVDCRIERVLTEGGRARRRRGRRGCARTARRSRSRSAPGRSSSPAARSSPRRCCCGRGSADRPPASTCGCTPRWRSTASTRRTRIRGGGRRRRASRTVGPIPRVTATASCSSARSTPPACSEPPCRGPRAPSTRPRCSSSAAAPPSSASTAIAVTAASESTPAARAVPTYLLSNEADIASFATRSRRWSGCRRRRGRWRSRR